MAKKKDEQLSYGQLPIPQTQNTYRQIKVSWSGLNKRQTIDTGALAMEKNISTAKAPYLTPSCVRKEKLSEFFSNDNVRLNYYEYDKTNNMIHVLPLGLFSFGENVLVVVYRCRHRIMIDYLKLMTSGNKTITARYTGIAKEYDTEAEAQKLDDTPRSMVQFNVYDNFDDAVGSDYTRRLVLFPEKVSMFAEIVDTDTNPFTMENPDINVMYCYEENEKTSEHKYKCRYYVYKRDSGDWVAADTGENGIAGKELLAMDHNARRVCFKADSLDVEVRSFYNDGYVKASGTYNEGFILFQGERGVSSNYWYFNDGYRLIDEGQYYNVSTEKNYTHGIYERVNVSGAGIDDYPYEYKNVTMKIKAALATHTTLNKGYEGELLDGYYVPRGEPNDYTPIHRRRYFKRTDEGVYEDVTERLVKAAERGGINSECQIKGLYFRDTSVEPNSGRTYYSRRKKSNKYTSDDGTVFRYEYEYTPDKVYGPSTNQSSEGVDDGTDLSELYYQTDNFNPPEDSDKSVFWFNTCTGACYAYAGGEWGVCVNPSFPDINYAVVHNSRLFGVSDDRVYVSGFNDYTNWELDTINDAKDSNAWCSPSQANTKADSAFTGIALYDNHVMCFKRNFMHAVYNTKNPFRIVDIYAEGTIDNRSICEVNNRLMFVSNGFVRVYAGAQPVDAGYYLGIDDFRSAVAGTDGRNYYLYCEERGGNRHLFTYDSAAGQWSEQEINAPVRAFAHNGAGMFMLTDEGEMYQIDTDNYNDQKWAFETDLSTVSSSSSSSTYRGVNIKHITKLQIFGKIRDDASLKVYMLYDGEEYNPDTSHLLYDSSARKDKSGQLAIRVKPRKTANYAYKLHFEGTGYVQIYYMELGIEQGGELLTQGGDFLV